MPWLAGAGAAAGGAAGGAAAGSTIGATAGSTLGAAGTAAMGTIPSATLAGGSALGAAAPGLGIAGTAPMAASSGLGLGGAAATPALSMGAISPSFWSQLTGQASKLGENIVGNLKQQASDRFQSATGGLTADPKGAQAKRIGTAKQKLPKLDAQDTSGTPAPGPRRGAQPSGSPNEQMAMILQQMFAPRGY